MWKRLAPYDAPRPWQSKAMVGTVGFMMEAISGVDPIWWCIALVA